MLNIVEYDNITDLKITNDYNNMTLSNCTTNENTIDIVIPSLLLTTPCGLSFLCLNRLMVYTLIQPLIKKHSIWRNISTQLILFVVL